MTRDFRDSWTMCSTNPAESCVMNVYLERVMLALVDSVSGLASPLNFCDLLTPYAVKHASSFRKVQKILVLES